MSLYLNNCIFVYNYLQENYCILYQRKKKKKKKKFCILYLNIHITHNSLFCIEKKIFRILYVTK